MNQVTVLEQSLRHLQTTELSKDRERHTVGYTCAETFWAKLALAPAQRLAAAQMTREQKLL